MDLKAVREEAIEATTRSFWDKNGFVPDEDSEEWEEEYRRQFEQAKKRHATGAPIAVKPAPAAEPPPEEEPGWAVLTGAPTQIRWAAGLRADRLHEIRDPGIRQWLATTWTKSTSWIDTSSLPTDISLKIEPHYAEYRRQADERARLLAAERRPRLLLPTNFAVRSRRPGSPSKD
jgi:hypothetical protein